MFKQRSNASSGRGFHLLKMPSIALVAVVFAIALAGLSAALTPSPANAQGAKQVLFGGNVSSLTETIDEGAAHKVSVTLSDRPTGTVTVDIDITNPSGVVVTTDTGRLTFTPLNFNKSQHVTVRVANDSDTTAGTATVDFDSSGGGYSSTSTFSVTVRETTSDGNRTQRGGIEVDKATVSITEGGTGSFSVKMSTNPTGVAIVTATSSDTGAVTVTSSNGIFSTARTFTVTGVQDTDALDEDVTITFSSTYEWLYKDPTDNTKTARVTSTVSQTVTVTVDDDETLTNSAPTISSAIADQAVSSGGSGTVTLSSHFSDSDSGDTLTYEAQSAFPSIATVSVSGATLTITAVKIGRTPIYVTATDSKGESSPADEVMVTVGVVAGDVHDGKRNVGDPADTVDLSKKFWGPSTMTYSASSSDSSKVSTSISGSTLTYTAVGGGEATITVTATAGSDSASFSFKVTVNTPPTVANTISDKTVAKDSTITVSLANVFNDADGDSLALRVYGNTNNLGLSLSGTTLTITGKVHAATGVGVGATDGKSAEVVTSFRVTVNSAPTVASAIADKTTTADVDRINVYTLDTVFSDADNDRLSYTWSSSDNSVVGTGVNQHGLILWIKKQGSATITVTATDPYGGSVSDSFDVAVGAAISTDSPPPPDNNDPPPPPVQDSEYVDPFDGETFEIKHVTDDSTACLDVQYGSAINGRDVQTWDCNETNAQKWTIERRTAGDYRGSYRLVSNLGDKNYCLDNRGDFTTSDRMGVWLCVGDSHWAAANQSVTIAAAGDGYTLTFTNGSSSVWLVTDRDSDDAQGGANQTTVSGAAGASAIWQIGDNPAPVQQQPVQPVPVSSDSDDDDSSDDDDNNTPIAMPNFDGQTYEVQHVTSDSTACLDVKHGNATDGQDVQTWECNDTNAQQWTFQKRTAGTYVGSYRLVSKLGNYCLDNRGDFSTSERMGIWSCVSDTHGAAANQSVTIAAAGDGYTLTFTNGSSSVWLVTDRASDNVQGDADQATVSGTAGASAIWRIVSD